ncbi:BamA/TamA family outer membrane protein [Oxalicibacterium solurbis]|nr:BamA/TamA family outer membrane protein [Oxalicibacterium solurbis]
MTDGTEHAEELSRHKDGKVNYVFLPIPQSNPAIGSGATLVGLALYNPNQSRQPWVSGIGVMRAGDSRATGIVQQANLMNSRLRLLAALGHANLDLKFYGIGADAGERGTSIPLEQTGTGGFVQALYEVGTHWFLGLRYQNMYLRSKFDLSQALALGAVIPEVDLQRRTVSIGPALEYDSRDDNFYPTRGVSAKANLNFYTEGLGSDVSFRQFSASWNRYWPMAADRVLAARVAGCTVSGNVPFSDLCMYGRNNDLRGYTTGQYRDRAMLAAQMEMRWRLAPRWGGVAFAGMGSIGSSLSDLPDEKILPSIGAGLRWQASKDYKVNVSLDVAVTRDDHAVYLYVGEAF